jgi:hypothetical protein
MVATPMCDERFRQPEQLAGREVSIRSDLQSLDPILHAMFSGKRAFDVPRRRHAAEPEQPRERRAPHRGARHSALPFRGAGLLSAERARHRRGRLRVVVPLGESRLCVRAATGWLHRLPIT